MNDLPFLDLDAATQICLPHAEAHARADYRFVYRYRASNGDEETLLARLCPVHAQTVGDYWCYCVVLRPENARDERIFLTAIVGHAQLPQCMAPADVDKWNWPLFEIWFAGPRPPILNRLWSPETAEGAFAVNCQSCGLASIGDAKGGASFHWKPDFGSDDETRELAWLRWPNREFQNALDSIWNDARHEIHAALTWSRMNETHRQARAFECRHGSWAQLQTVATLVLQVRYGTLHDQPYSWQFAENDLIFRAEHGGVPDDAALLLWRRALTCHFDTPNFDGDGVRLDSCPNFLWEYIRASPLGIIEAAPLTNHELMEANLQLQTWARAHFSPENAHILMRSLAKFSATDAQKFYDSFSGDSDR